MRHARGSRYPTTSDWLPPILPARSWAKDERPGRRPGHIASTWISAPHNRNTSPAVFDPKPGCAASVTSFTIVGVCTTPATLLAGLVSLFEDFADEAALRPAAEWWYETSARIEYSCVADHSRDFATAAVATAITLGGNDNGEQVGLDGRLISAILVSGSIGDEGAGGVEPLMLLGKEFTGGDELAWQSGGQDFRSGKQH